MPITQISENSWDAIQKIQQEAYTELPPEDINILKKKWTFSPGTCSIFTSNDGEILAYLLAHPWASDKPPTLNEDISISNQQTSTLYLHDLALSNKARGKGIAKTMVKDLISKAKTKRFTKVLLVAVQSSSSFWAKYGFVVIDNAAICPSYGSCAKLMRLEL